MATLVVFGSLGLARFGYTMVLPAMQAGLDIDNTQTGALATANLVGYLALAVIGGALAARYGPRVVIAAGLAVAGAGMMLTGSGRRVPRCGGLAGADRHRQRGQQRAGDGAAAGVVRQPAPGTGFGDRRGRFGAGAHLLRGRGPPRSVCLR